MLLKTFRHFINDPLNITAKNLLALNLEKTCFFQFSTSNFTQNLFIFSKNTLSMRKSRVLRIDKSVLKHSEISPISLRQIKI